MAALAGADMPALVPFQQLSELPVECVGHLWRGMRSVGILGNVYFHRLAGRREAINLGHLSPDLDRPRLKFLKGRRFGRKRKLVVATPPHVSFLVPCRGYIEATHPPILTPRRK
jgi:hypothetical protein